MGGGNQFMQVSVGPAYVFTRLQGAPRYEALSPWVFTGCADIRGAIMGDYMSLESSSVAMVHPKIYISHFQPAFTIRSETLVPIQVGAALSPVRLNMIGDDTGNNISNENPLYCELTAHYWAWKNDLESTHLGFFHYRRFLDIKDHKNHAKDTPHGIIEEELTDESLAEYGLEDGAIAQIVAAHDLVIPKPYDVRSAGYRSVEHHYRAAPDHRGKDFQVAREVISQISPEYSKFFEKMAKGVLLYPANILIARREIFESYARWIFPVLNAIRLAVDTSGYNRSEMRFVGYLAERLTTVFILKQIEEGKADAIKELPLIFVRDARPQPDSPLLPVTDLALVSVVASSDEAYAPHLAALISSIFRNASQDRFIDFVVLGEGLTRETKKELRLLERLHPHCSVGFVTMDRMFTKLRVHTYFARSTFFRLGMADILHNRDRVLFLDTDMVVLGDVCELFDTDLGGQLVAACKDMIMLSFRVLGVPSMVEAGGMPAKRYLSDRIGMRGREDEYFQAGTILFDLEAMRKTSLCNDMVDDLMNQTFWFLDQDVLNKHLVGRVKFLDNKWNAVHMDAKHLNSLPDIDRRAHLEAQENPAIIHYAGPAKPWLNELHPLGSHYWFFLRETLWYERMLIQRIAGARGAGPAMPMEAQSRLRKALSAGWRALPNSVRPIFGPVARFLVRNVR